MSKDLIDNYISTGSPFDKAGAYGIQDEFSLRAIERVNGSYTAIMGFPIVEINAKLAEMGCVLKS